MKCTALLSTLISFVYLPTWISSIVLRAILLHWLCTQAPFPRGPQAPPSLGPVLPAASTKGASCRLPGGSGQPWYQYYLASIWNFLATKLELGHILIFGQVTTNRKWNPSHVWKCELVLLSEHGPLQSFLSRASLQKLFFAFAMPFCSLLHQQRRV